MRKILFKYLIKKIIFFPITLSGKYNYFFNNTNMKQINNISSVIKKS